MTTTAQPRAPELTYTRPEALFLAALPVGAIFQVGFLLRDQATGNHRPPVTDAYARVTDAHRDGIVSVCVSEFEERLRNYPTAIDWNLDQIFVFWARQGGTSGYVDWRGTYGRFFVAPEQFGVPLAQAIAKAIGDAAEQTSIADAEDGPALADEPEDRETHRTAAPDNPLGLGYGHDDPTDPSGVATAVMMPGAAAKTVELLRAVSVQVSYARDAIDSDYFNQVSEEWVRATEAIAGYLAFLRVRRLTAEELTERQRERERERPAVSFQFGDRPNGMEA